MALGSFGGAARFRWKRIFHPYVFEKRHIRAFGNVHLARAHFPSAEINPWRYFRGDFRGALVRISGPFVDFSVIYIFPRDASGILVGTGPLFSHAQWHFMVLVRLSGSF